MGSDGCDTEDKNLRAATGRKSLASQGLVVEQAQSEAALILFTLFVPMSLGIAHSAFLFDTTFMTAVVVFGVATIGMLSSIAHLAKPFRAPYSILHWKTSWLSREILAVSAYWGLCLVWLLLFLMGQPMMALIVHIIVALFGFVLIAVIGRAYMTHARPAWNGYENILELLSVVFGLGFAAGAFLGNLSGTALSPFPFVICAFMMLLGYAFFTLAHKLRIKRLSLSVREDKSYKHKVDLENYPKQSQLRLIKGLQLVALVFAVLATVFLPFHWVATALWLCAIIAEAIAQAKARHIFYELSVQVKHVPLWR